MTSDKTMDSCGADVDIAYGYIWSWKPGIRKQHVKILIMIHGHTHLSYCSYRWWRD